jgi:hypothetical protein
MKHIALIVIALMFIPAITFAQLNNDERDLSKGGTVPAAPQRKEAAEGSIKNGTALGGVKVYIHYARDKDKKKAEALAVFLRGKGYATVETEKIYHRKRDIRYFHDEDEDEALLLKKYLNDFIVGSAKTAKFNIHIENLSTRYPHAQEGSLEVWIFFSVTNH